MQGCGIDGGQFALAMPRGSGKTTLCDAAVLWAILYGHRQFVVFIGAEASSSKERIDALKLQLENNDLLLEDFPEVCYPIRKLEGIAHRCNGQLCEGERTQMEWTADAIVLPTVKGSKASGSVLRVAGITGRIRGMNVNKRRPDLAVIDDPQTDESAKSPDQSHDRLQTINGTILGLAGPRKKIAAFVLCTVIRAGDLADQLLDRQKHPVWQGERCKLLYEMPKRMDLWERYAAVRSASYRANNGGSESRAFYESNREAMDEGAKVAWPARHNPDQLSGLQYAMDLYFDSPESFSAEYQNDPKPLDDNGDKLKAEAVVTRLVNVKRGVVPLSCHKLTAYVDVQGKALFWSVCAWGDGFTGHVVDYGVFPEQGVMYTTLADIKRTLATVGPRGAGQMGQIRDGLDKLADALLARAWQREDGVMMKVDRAGVDANWGASTNTVYEWCRSRKEQLFIPGHGKYVGPTAKPISEYQRKPGEQIGDGWMIAKGRRAVRHLLIDTNHWKSFVHGSFSTPIGDNGALTLFGSRGEELFHKMLADNVTAETRTRVEGKGRTMDLWTLTPGRDNHFLDCLVGCAALAATLGVTHFKSVPKPVARKPQRVRVSYI